MEVRHHLRNHDLAATLRDDRETFVTVHHIVLTTLRYLKRDEKSAERAIDAIEVGPSAANLFKTA